MITGRAIAGHAAKINLSSELPRLLVLLLDRIGPGRAKLPLLAAAAALTSSYK